MAQMRSRGASDQRPLLGGKADLLDPLDRDRSRLSLVRIARASSFLRFFCYLVKIHNISMPFDPGFARQTLLPLAVHAYTEAGLPEDCESLDTKVFYIVG